MTPVMGLLALAKRRLGMRPLSKARRPAWTAWSMAWAMRMGSPA